MGTWKRLAAVGGAAALLVSVGCGDDANQAADGKDITSDLDGGETGGFAATPGYLQKVVDQSDDQAYRFEMDVSVNLGVAPIEIDGLATGEFDGTRQHMTMDMGAMFDQMMGQIGGGDIPEELEGLFDGDMTVETIVDTDAMYMRAPFFASMFGNLPADEVGEAGDLLGAFTSMGDSWGKVDLSELGDILPGEAASALGGGQTYDPQVFLDMIKGSETVEELGTDEIDGVSVSGLAADVSMADMLEAQGMDSATAGGELDGLTFPIKVWIDRDDQIRRVSYSLDAESMADAAEAAGEDLDDMDIGSEMASFEVGMTMDFTDYGDASIQVEVPTGDDVVDITQDFVEGYESLGELTIADSLTES